MIKKYEIELTGKGYKYGTTAVDVECTQYRCDNGSSVTDTPKTAEEKRIVEACKGLVKTISPYAELKIKFEEINLR
jgi:hypothetical protein